MVPRRHWNPRVLDHNTEQVENIGCRSTMPRFGGVRPPQKPEGLSLMLHPVLETVFHAFEQAGARWCLLRVPLELGAAAGGDVDLLIDCADIENVRRVLETLGFIQVRPQPRSVHTHFLTYHRTTDCWIWLDLVTELSFGRHNALQTSAEVGCLARRQYHGAVVRLARDDDFWALLLHCILDKGSIAPRHAAMLQELMGEVRTDGPLAQVVETVCPAGWTLRRILACISGRDWIALERMAPSMTAIWLRQNATAPSQILIRRGLNLMDYLIKLRSSKGLGVALLGPDGAGKTTLIMEIQESFILPVRSVYMGLTGGLLRYIAYLHVPGLVLLGRLLVFWCRYLLAQYHQARGRLVLFDRYIYDAMVPHPERLNWLRRASRWVDGHACPGPDLVLVLNAPGEVLYARKGEYTPEQLEEWRHHFLALQQRIPQLEIVDTTRKRDAVRIDVTDRIWQRYLAHSAKNSSARCSVK